eukprot:CAMPEP_0180813050 /NCGR_PEP_ID=MMETSP1038_2-20121128/66336_1 /TAXON_ID=632150 /ORGANISM="Azadinium spinosum, Strain 3D9" /LENGTH=74 /DNA_ID=CAMNT_0022854631 /DNA_START=351 /DNA_END=575 /DNA_ORIENTATION=+
MTEAKTQPLQIPWYILSQQPQCFLPYALFVRPGREGSMIIEIDGQVCQMSGETFEDKLRLANGCGESSTPDEKP